jgi:hypothetical protein
LTGFFLKRGKIFYKHVYKFFYSLKFYSLRNPLFIFSLVLDSFSPTLKLRPFLFVRKSGKKRKKPKGKLSKGKKNKPKNLIKNLKFIIKKASSKNKKFLTYS